MKEVAQVLDVSESRVSQIHSQALRGIRALLEERRQTLSRQPKKQRSGK